MKYITIICLFLIFSVALFVQAEENVNMFDTPINPDNYLIRPGDQLLITFINSQVKALPLDIDPEGKIVHETIGVINLQHQTLAYAKRELTKTLKQLYNVKEIEVSISTPRQVTIAVYGSVRRPGMYSGMTSDRVSDIIKKAGGISKNGSTRNILFYAGENHLTVDLDKAMHQGDLISNPHLYAGIAIEVPNKSSQTVHITGNVNFPREIELKEGDDLSLIIQLAGKFKNSAKLSDVCIVRGNKKIENSDIQAGDIIIVKSTILENNKKIKIFGAVRNQGLYPFVGSVSLEDIISQAGGFIETANRDMTTVFRQPLVDSHGEISEIRYPISIPSQTNSNSSLRLEVNDSIFVPWYVGFVKVSGAVLNPGYFPYKNNSDILYYVNSAGGFLPTANNKEIKIFNPISENTDFVSSGIIVPDGAEIIIQVKEELK